MANKKISKSIRINAPVEEVWQAITDPSIVKLYFFGTNLWSDWREGGPISYSGVWEGKEYEDKGIIQQIEKENTLKHTYWSSMSGIEDIPENYAIVTYELEDEDDGTKLTITQENQKGTAAEKAYSNSGDNWEMVLNKMKELLEKQYHSQH